MVKLLKKYLAGDKVFAKVRGYPPWPARIESVSDGNPKSAKYKVYFYGTGETASCKGDELFDYLEHKEKMGKSHKRKIFHEGMQQLELELNKDQEKAESLPEMNDDLKEDDNQEEVPESVDNEADRAELAPTGINLDSDADPKPLVIDEGEKKKSLKRKSMAVPPTNMEPDTKKKRGRGKSLPALPEEKLDLEPSPVEEGNVGKEVVSRSGRKIKPKRFADFTADDEYDLDTTGRSRAKPKIEDNNDSTPTVSRKKIIPEIEKKSVPKENGTKLQRLRIESKLLKLELNIASSLDIDHADTDKCLEALDEMHNLPIDSLMLKKHPIVVETIKRLRRYIGNLSKWKFDEDEKIIFKQKAEQIRQKAEEIFIKFKSLFIISDGQSFWQTFTNQVDQFKHITKVMTEDQVFGMITEPEALTTSDTACGDETVSQEGASSTDEPMDNSDKMDSSILAK